MRKSFRLLAALSSVAALPLVAAGPAQAAPPRTVTGEVQVFYFEELSRRVVGGENVTLTEYINRSVVSEGGVPVGTQEEQARCVIRAESLSCHGSVTFTRGFDGVGPDTLTSRLHVSCVVLTGACAGTTVPVHGTGDLVRTSSRSTFTGNLYTGSFTYVTVLHGP